MVTVFKKIATFFGKQDIKWVYPAWDWEAGWGSIIKGCKSRRRDLSHILYTMELLEVFWARERGRVQDIRLTGLQFCFLPSGDRGLLSVPRTHQVCSCLRAFVLIISFVWNAFSQFSGSWVFFSFSSFRGRFKCLLLKGTFPDSTSRIAPILSLSRFLCLFVCFLFCSEHFLCSEITFLVCLPIILSIHVCELHEGKELFSYSPSYPRCLEWYLSHRSHSTKMHCWNKWMIECLGWIVRGGGLAESRPRDTEDRKIKRRLW